MLSIMRREKARYYLEEMDVAPRGKQNTLIHSEDKHPEQDDRRVRLRRARRRAGIEQEIHRTQVTRRPPRSGEIQGGNKKFFCAPAGGRQGILASKQTPGRVGE